MSESVVLTLKQTVTTETGDRHVSDLTEIDVGFGNYLLTLLDGIKELNQAKYQALYRYVQREPSKKLFSATETDPKRFVTSVRRKFFEKADGKTMVSEKNRNALPLVYFHRSLGLDQSLTGEEVITKNVGDIYDEDNNLVAQVDALPCTVTYMVYILAWDRQTLDKLVTGLTAGLLTSSRTVSFLVSLMGLRDDVEATIKPVNSASWIDMSPPTVDDRLLVYQLPLEVTANYFQARCVTSSQVTFEIMEPTMMYTGEV